MIGYGNSDITANAVQGNGGNIDISTQGLLGLNFRDQLTLESDITASSEFGLEGVVEIQPIVLNPEAGLTTLPTDLVDTAQQIVAGCMANSAANFVVTGRGGVSLDPSQSVLEDILLQSFELSPLDEPTREIASLPLDSDLPLSLEATRWVHNAEGDVMFMTPVLMSASKDVCLGKT